MRLVTAANAQFGEAARVVIWHPNVGMNRDFEEGYKRHLGWHQRNQDTWNWFGWTFVSGEHYGDFVDGTFFHNWADLDSPVAPAADAADNTTNVLPYAAVRLASVYETVTDATELPMAGLGAPLVTFCWFDIAPGRNKDFEIAITKALAADRSHVSSHMLLRPIDGSSRYLLVFSALKSSEVKQQPIFSLDWLQRSSRTQMRAQPFCASTPKRRASVPI